MALPFCISGWCNEKAPRMWFIPFRPTLKNKLPHMTSCESTPEIME